MITEQQISSQNLPNQRAAITATTGWLLIYFYEFLGAFEQLQKSITRLKNKPILEWIQNKSSESIFGANPSWTKNCKVEIKNQQLWRTFH